MGVGHVGKYRLEGELGAGAHGRVVKAHDTVLGRTVALKLLKTPEGGNQKALKHEAKMLARLSHANIVTLYELFDSDDGPILVMEYVDGAPLASRLTKGPLPVGDAITIIEQLVDALDFANDMGITHGDIKPSNIMLGNAGTPLLVDFGLAKFSSRNAALETLSGSGATNTSLEGTIPYMAPETIMGTAVDKRADIFSLGAVFYEMITGKRAFDAPNQGAILNRVLNDAPPLIGTLRRDAPRWIATLIEMMLEKNPELRLQSMAAVRGCLAARGKRDWRTRTKAFGARAFRFARKKRSIPQWTKAALLGAITATTIWAINVIIVDVAPPVSVQIDRGINLVQHFERKGAIEGAQKIFGNILSEDPTHAAAQAGLALALIREYTSMETDPATLRRATAYAEAALKEDPLLALANIATAWAAEFESDFERAHELYDAADALGRNNPLIPEGRARTFKKQGNFEKALITLEKAIETYPKVHLFYDDYGDLLTRQGRYTEAERIFRQSIEIQPENTIGYANLAQTLHAQGKTDQAISTIQDGLKIRKNSNLYNNLGTYLFFQGRFEQAAQAFERTLEYDGNTHDYFYWANLADAYRWTPGKRSDAKTAYRRAIQLLQTELSKRPDHPALNSRNALYSAKLGDREAAQRSLEKLFISGDLHPVQLYRVTVALEVLGDRKSALRMLERTIDSGYAFNEITRDPELEKLRQDPAYHQMLSRKGVSHE